MKITISCSQRGPLCCTSLCEQSSKDSNNRRRRSGSRAPTSRLSGDRFHLRSGKSSSEKVQNQRDIDIPPRSFHSSAYRKSNEEEEEEEYNSFQDEDSLGDRVIDDGDLYYPNAETNDERAYTYTSSTGGESLLNHEDEFGDRSLDWSVNRSNGGYTDSSTDIPAVRLPGNSIDRPTVRLTGNSIDKPTVRLTGSSNDRPKAALTAVVNNILAGRATSRLTGLPTHVLVGRRKLTDRATGELTRRLTNQKTGEKRKSNGLLATDLRDKHAHKDRKSRNSNVSPPQEDLGLGVIMASMAGKKTRDGPRFRSLKSGESYQGNDRRSTSKIPASAANNRGSTRGRSIKVTPDELSRVSTNYPKTKHRHISTWTRDSANFENDNEENPGQANDNEIDYEYSNGETENTQALRDTGLQSIISEDHEDNKQTTDGHRVDEVFLPYSVSQSKASLSDTSTYHTASESNVTNSNHSILFERRARRRVLGKHPHYQHKYCSLRTTNEESLNTLNCISKTPSMISLRPKVSDAYCGKSVYKNQQTREQICSQNSRHNMKRISTRSFNNLINKKARGERSFGPRQKPLHCSLSRENSPNRFFLIPVSKSLQHAGNHVFGSQYKTKDHRLSIKRSSHSFKSTKEDIKQNRSEKNGSRQQYEKKRLEKSCCYGDHDISQEDSLCKYNYCAKAIKMASLLDEDLRSSSDEYLCNYCSKAKTKTCECDDCQNTVRNIRRCPCNN